VYTHLNRSELVMMFQEVDEDGSGTQAVSRLARVCEATFSLHLYCRRDMRVV
jgi:hypothetical protein